MIVRLSIVALILSLLLGCTLQSAPLPAAPGSPAAETPPTPPPAVDVAPPPDAPAETSSWTIGLLDEPGNVLPFSPDGRAAAPIVEAIFPAPALGHSFAYTTTGILSVLPSFENGDLQLTEVSGFLDSTGQFTLTETTQPTTTEQLVVTYRWNPELRWADGEAVTAADSVFAYELLGDVQAPQEAQVVRAMLESYEQIDEHTTRATLKPGRVDPSYLLTAWPPLPQHQLGELPPEDALAELKRQPLGYGPYTFGEQEAGKQLTLSRNPFWIGGTAHAEQLIFRFFASADELRSAVVSGEVDVGVMERIPPDLYPYLEQDQESGAAEVSFVPGPVYEHLDFNLSDERLQDVRVRRALAHAIDTDSLNQSFFGGKARRIHSWILPEQGLFYAGEEQLSRYPYDPDRARELLDEAGLTDKDGDGVREQANNEPFSISLLTTETTLRQGMAEKIAADLTAVGVRVDTELQPIDQFYSPTGPLYRRNFQLALFAWITSVDPGGIPLWSCNAVPIQENGYTGNNFVGWCFEAAEWPLQRANSVLDERIRAQEYVKQQRAWTQEVPVVPLLQRPFATLQQPKLTGVQPDPLAPITWNVDQWRREP